MNSRTLAKFTEVQTEIDYLKSIRREVARAVYLRELKKLQTKRKDIEEDLEQERRSMEVQRKFLIEQEKKKKKKEAEDLKKRTFVLNQAYDREARVFDKKKGTFRTLQNLPGTFTFTATIIRKPGESLAIFQRRAERMSRNEILRLNSVMIEGETADTEFKYSAVGKPTLSQVGGRGMGMSRIKPWVYENSGFYSIAEHGKCVPSSLVQLYPKHTIEYFAKELFPDGNDQQPCLAEWIYNYCVRSDITCIGCNEFYEILKGEETQVPLEYYSRNRNHKPLYFVEKDNHFYVMDKEKALSIVHSRKNSFKKDKQEKESIPKQKIFIENDLEAIDFKAFENKHLVVRKISFVKTYLVEYMKEFHSVPQLFFGVTGENTIYLKSFLFGKNNRLSFDPHYAIVKKASEKLNIPFDSIKTVSEEYALKTIGVVPMSFMNNNVMDIFLNWKQRQHFAHLPTPGAWELVPGQEQTWDANKQYTSILRNSKHNWLLFDMFCVPMPYSGSITDAYYFIQTTNTMPCKGNGWYSRSIAEFLIENNIEHTIINEIKASQVLPASFFVPFVDTVVKELPEGFKYIINTFCGALNTHEKKNTSVQTSSDKCVALEKVLSKGNSMCSFDIGDDKMYCSVAIKSELLYKNNMPMYSQILDGASIQLAKTILHLQKKGCSIRSYNTDSVTFKHEDILEIDISREALGGWKNEVSKPFEYQISPLRRKDRFLASEYTFEVDKKDTDFDNTMIEFLQNNSCFISAPAGYGKSYVAEKVIEAVGAEKCCVLGYTNIASNNIGGNTFHKTFKISIDDYKGAIPVAQIMKEKDILIIDEISQLPSKLYKIIEEVIKMEKKVLIFGDLLQILPVGETRDPLLMLKLMVRNRITLTTYRRGDAELLECLTSVRERISIPFEQKEKGSLHFCFTKKMRDIINEREIQKVKRGYFDLVKNENLKRIFVGMPLRSIITKKDLSMLNGERWTIKNIDEEIELHSTTRDTTLYVPFDKIHETFKPGFAMTIHSSQGLTIQEPYTVHIEDKSGFDIDDKWRMVYTAVSRACSKSQVGIIYS